jgi:hypothetical protein
MACKAISGMDCLARPPLGWQPSATVWLAAKPTTCGRILVPGKVCIVQEDRVRSTPPLLVCIRPHFCTFEMAMSQKISPVPLFHLSPPWTASARCVEMHEWRTSIWSDPG